MFISILTLMFVSVVVGSVASQWHFDLLETPMLSKIMVHEKVQWKHVVSRWWKEGYHFDEDGFQQYTYSIIFACFNFLNFILLATAADQGYSVFVPGVSLLNPLSGSTE